MSRIEAGITFGKNTKDAQNPNGAYPIRKNGRDVGCITYGPTGHGTGWHVIDYGTARSIGYAHHLQSARDLARKHFSAALVAALVLILAGPAHAAPTGCAITGSTAEGFPVATCEDGSRIYQDLDGQPYPNDAGYPVYPPGTWVEMP